MHAAVRSAAALNIDFFTKELFECQLKNLLNGDCIFLNLPAVIARAVVADGYQIIYHITAAESVFI